MDVKKAATDQLMKLIQNPTVMKVAMNPTVMGAVMKTMSLRGKLSSTSSAAAQSLAHWLNLATRDEIKELRRTVRRLEELINDLEAREQDSATTREV